jgi:hypothetical protein
MKRIILLYFFLGIFCLLQAQDIIVKTNGEEISARVTEVGITEIKYKKVENAVERTYTLLKTDVFMIKYANGTKDLFSAASERSAPQQKPVPQQQPVEQPPVQEYVAPVEVSVVPVQKATPPSAPPPAKQEKSKNKTPYKKNAFELGFTLSNPVAEEWSWRLGFDLGMGYLHNFSRYFGWDIFQFKFSIPLQFEGFDYHNIGISLWTGPKVYFAPVSNKTVPFLACRYGTGTSIGNFSDFNLSHLISPEFGINFGRSFYFSFGYNHAWTKIKWQEQESYITGYKKIWLSSQQQYLSVPQYATRTVTKNQIVNNGTIYFCLGFNF